VKAWAKDASLAAQIEFKIVWKDSGGSTLSTDTGSYYIYASGGWNLYVAAFESPASTAQCVISILGVDSNDFSLDDAFFGELSSVNGVPSTLIINEVDSYGSSNSEYVELLNIGDNSIDVDNLQLAKKSGRSWVTLSLTNTNDIPARGYLLIYFGTGINLPIIQFNPTDNVQDSFDLITSTFSEESN